MNARQRTLWRGHRDTLRKFQDNQCCWCGKPMQRERSALDNYETIEHLIPKSKGGTDNIKNLALAHYKCNQARGTEDREPLLRAPAPIAAQIVAHDAVGCAE